jgi:hypothetical protein
MAWAVGNCLNKKRRGIAGAGVQGAALSFGGIANAYTTESFDGNSWTERAGLNVANAYHAGCGLANAALSFGSFNSDASIEYSTSEEYNAIVWTLTNALNTTRYALGGCGTMAAALAFCGLVKRFITNIKTSNCDVLNNDIDFYHGSAEIYDGNCWSATNNLNTRKAYVAGAGTSGAGLCIGGLSSLAATLSTTEEFDGTSWSTGGNLNTGRYALAANGSQIASLCFGGNNNSKATEKYNGVAWANDSNLVAGRRDLGGCGTTTAGLSFGGYTASNLATTEYYT